MINVGDTVRYLNAVGGGRVVRISGNIAYVDEDGFETPVLVKECVVVGHAPEKPREAVVAPPKPSAAPPSKETPGPAPRTRPEPDDEPVEETPEGEKLNVVLAYEPHDIKHLSDTAFDAYLVNDSNYYLYFTYLTRSDDDPAWTARYAGVIEPQIQLLLGEVAREDIVMMDRVAVQYIAFKRDKPFAIKNPASVEQRLDNTKFFKLHCFRDNVYFDTPVIALDVVRDDVPRTRHTAVVDAEALEREMKRKKAVDRPVRRAVRKRRPSAGDTIEVDLHINELVDTTRGLSSADCLNLQVDKFREVMDANLANHGVKIVFIHGKGEGVLRAALIKELNHRYKGNDVQDASFREYGYGATQVTIR